MRSVITLCTVLLLVAGAVAVQAQCSWALTYCQVHAYNRWNHCMASGHVEEYCTNVMQSELDLCVDWFCGGQ